MMFATSHCLTGRCNVFPLVREGLACSARELPYRTDGETSGREVVVQET